MSRQDRGITAPNGTAEYKAPSPNSLDGLMTRGFAIPRGDVTGFQAAEQERQFAGIKSVQVVGPSGEREVPVTYTVVREAVPGKPIAEGVVYDVFVPKGKALNAMGPEDRVVIR